MCVWHASFSELLVGGCWWLVNKERSVDWTRNAMAILERIQSPADVRRLSREELPLLAQEIRARLIDVCSRTGGHIGAGLGVVELTVALHRVFETPRDQLV